LSKKGLKREKKGEMKKIFLAILTHVLGDDVSCPKVETEHGTVGLSVSFRQFYQPIESPYDYLLKSPQKDGISCKEGKQSSNVF